jgi:hypothetical protein
MGHTESQLYRSEDYGKRPSVPIFIYLMCGGAVTYATESRAPSVQAVPWKPPPDEVYEQNVDASFLCSSGKGGWGFVVRNHGQFLEGGAGSIIRASSALSCCLNE